MLGLEWSDLFPVGHRHARPIRVLSGPRPALELVLAAPRASHRYRGRVTQKVGGRDVPAVPVVGRLPLLIREDDRERSRLSAPAAATNGRLFSPAPSGMEPA